MPVRAAEVDNLLRDLVHPLKPGVERLRSAILEADPGVTEHVKWNAPSFMYAGEDRVTFKLRPSDRIQLIFHRGAKVRKDSDRFTFHDPTGLMKWVSADRGVVTFNHLDAVDANRDQVVRLVAEWVRA